MLGLGNTTPYQIAKKSGLKAPITYIVLDSLLKRGLVLKTPYKSGWRFQAKRIDEYLIEREQAANDLSNISNIVNSLIKGSPESKILFFEGVEEINTALRYKLENTKNFVAFYGSANNISKELREVFLNWYAELKKFNIKQQVIAPADSSLSEFRALDRAYGNETKEVDFDKYNSESSIEIHDSFIRSVMLTKEKCVIIEDENLPVVLRSIFKMVWQIL
jgi:sugar-specific transcriptional regulator TrmB